VFLKDSLSIISETRRAGKNPSTQSKSAAQIQLKTVEFSRGKKRVGLCYPY
jgi:hypothetical protein